MEVRIDRKTNMKTETKETLKDHMQSEMEVKGKILVEQIVIQS